jgi:hypothetical protein
LYKSWKSRTTAFAVAAMLAIPVLGNMSAAGAANGGNSANARACQRGGWQHLQTETGGTFRNQGDCVSHAANGGQIFNPTVTVDPDVVTFAEFFLVSVRGFHPNSQGHTLLGFTGQPPLGDFPDVTDPTGGFDHGLNWVGFCANPAASFEMTISFTDGFGVTASTTQTLNCS